MTLQMKVKVAEQHRELTLIKYMCIRVYKKGLFNKLHLAKKQQSAGTGVRFQVC